MSKANGQITLSAVDFLKLAEVKRVARVDLVEAGLSGVVYVCDLSTAQQQQLFGGQDSIRTYGDGSREISMPKDAASKMLRASERTSSSRRPIIPVNQPDPTHHSNSPPNAPPPAAKHFVQETFPIGFAMGKVLSI